MHIEFGNIEEIKNIDELIDNSFNGTCFAYSWFLKFKNSNKILKILNDKNELQGFMPYFNSGNSKLIFQSTMYIPYGGPVIFNLPKENRNKIRYIRNVEKVLCKFIKENFESADFSIDNEIIDIMPFIRNNFTPEVRYTYKLDLSKGIEEIFKNYGSDRKKDIKRAIKRNYEFVVDKDIKYFDTNKAMKWETKYNYESTALDVKDYIRKTIKHNRGMCFVALENGKVVGGVHMAWDKKTAYILYSYYEEKQDDVAIAFLYHQIFKFFIENDIVKYVDFEGSVFESIEDFNISFGTYQSRFYNMHWNKENKPYLNLYDYGEK